MPTDNKRTKMIHIYTPAGGVYRLEVERETIRTYENGDALPVPSENKIVQRVLADIEAAALPGGPVTVSTYGDLKNVISACAAALALEDEQAAAAQQSEPEVTSP